MDFNQVTLSGKTYYMPVDNQLYRAEPQLKTPDKGDWYVYYSVWNFETGKWLPQKWYSEHLNKKDLVSKPKERLINGESVRKVAYNMLKTGVNPKTGLSISPIVNKTAEEIITENTSDSPIPTVKVAIDKWVKIKAGKDNPNKEAPENKENTGYIYGYFFNTFLAYCKVHKSDNIRLDRVPKHLVYNFFEERYTKGKIGDLTWNIQLGYLKGMFAHYSKLYEYPNAIANIELKEVIEDSERFEPFTPEQLKKIFNFLDNPYEFKYRNWTKKMPPNKLLAYTCRTIFYSFIRVSELRRLRIKHVKRYKEGYFDLTIDITKTKKKIFNSLYLDPRLVAEFEKLEWEKYFTDKKYDNYYVFSKDMVPSAERTDIYYFNPTFKWVLEKLEIYDGDRFSLYSLKASGNIDAFNSGWDLFQISLQNRHTTTKQTETYLRKLKCNIAEKPRPERKAI